MPFVARNAATLRDAYLSDLHARHLAEGREIDIQEGSDAYIHASALALILEGEELAAEQATDRLLVRSSFGSDLVQFAEDVGTSRRAAVAARRHVVVTGSPSTAYTITGRTLNASSGVAFNPIDTAGAALTSVTTDGSGNATILTECAEAGTDGNLTTSTVLTWSSAPSGMGSTGTVTPGASAREGAAAEEDDALQIRVLELMRERPASGNRADWRAKVMEVTRVENAYVYPLMTPAGVAHTPGCVTVIAVGEAQGDSTTNTRILGGSPGAVLAAEKGYLEGTYDVDGNTLSSTSGVDTQWRNVTIETDDYTVRAANEQSQNIVAEIRLASNASWSWTGAALTIASSTTTTIVIAGDQRSYDGKDALVFIGTGNTRGGWTKIGLGAGVYATGNTTFTFTALAAAPDTSKGAYPAPSNWSALRTAAFAHFDSLAPGDVDTALYPRSARFPPESWGAGYYSNLYRQVLARDLMAVSGVLTANITTPSGDVAPAAAWTVVTLGQLLFVKA